MEPWLPHDVLYRPKKGFAVPMAAWFRGPLRARLHAALASEVLNDTGVFDRGRLARIVAEHDSGQRDWSNALWSVLMFEAFLRSESA
jgi:asparagine synthase (glutamine-hydrolysing)